MLCALFWFFFSKTALIRCSWVLSALAASLRYSLTLSRKGEIVNESSMTLEEVEDVLKIRICLV